MADEKPRRGFWGTITAHPILALVFGAAIGAFGQDFASFLGQERAARQKAIDSSQAITGELNSLLRLYAQIGAGEKPNTADEIERLRTMLTTDRASAANITSVMPTLQPLYAAYEAATVDLIQSAEDFRDARDAPELTEAVSEYLYTRENLTQQAIDSNGSYLYGLNPLSKWRLSNEPN